MALSQILDVGDGKTIDRDIALEATRHFLLAQKLTLGVPSIHDNAPAPYEGWIVELATGGLAHLLGGDDWWEISEQLIDAVLKQKEA